MKGNACRHRGKEKRLTEKLVFLQNFWKLWYNRGGGRTMIQNKLKENICDTVLKTTPAESITVFGSFAHDEEREDSDIDLCVITNEDRKTIEIMTSLRLALAKIIDKPLDLVVYSSKLFDNRLKTGFAF